MMRLRIAPGSFEEASKRAAEVLERGGIGIIPTETVYGLAARASDETAIARLLEIKERPTGKPLPVQVSGVEAAGELAKTGRPAARKLMERFWPGPLTLVLPVKPGVELPFQGSAIGIRIPADYFCRALIERSGALVVPSANRSGEPPPASLEEVAPGLLELVDFVVDGGPCAAGTESTVVDLTGEPRVLREGAISAAEIRAAVEGVADDA